MLGPPSFPAPNSQQRLSVQTPNNGERRESRTKVALKPGRSLMDWIRLANGGKDIQGFHGQCIPVTVDELSKHNKIDDCWMAIKGRVYNVTHYMEYHPGGIDELMRGAGKDATDLFNQVHKWVNYNSMLAKCYVGPLKVNSVDLNKNKRRKTPEISTKKSDGLLVTTNLPVSKPVEVIPRYDWYEKEEQIVLSIYTKTKLIDSKDIIMDCSNDRSLSIKTLFRDNFYFLHIELLHPIESIEVTSVSGNKAEFVMIKKDGSVRWKTLGNPSSGHNAMHAETSRDILFRECCIENVEKVTHDTKLYSMRLPSNVVYESPIGHHVVIKNDIEGMEIRRNYTVALASLQQKTSTDINRGKLLHFLIKCYADGALTPYIDQLKIGDRIFISDCIGTFHKSRLKEANDVYLIAAGTGITPMIRIINHYILDQQSSCRIKLIFVNKEEKDIIWKNQLDELASSHPDRFHLTYILSQSSPGWVGLQGRINEKILQQFLSDECFKSSSSINKTPSIQREEILLSGLDKLYAICGPDQFTTSMESILHTFGVRKESIHCFLA